MTMENQNAQELEPAIEVVFDCSVENEIKRVEYTLKKYGWFQENGYKVKFPAFIQLKLEKGEAITANEIAESVSAEFDLSVQTEQITLIREEWDLIKERFFGNLKTLGLPLQEKYLVFITKYGGGGSYNLPNCVQLNVEQKREVSLTLVNEIVHLTIERLIKEYGIAHWVKERLVDLVINRFFPENQKLQRNPENADQISEIFDSHFLDIAKIIKSVAEIK